MIIKFAVKVIPTSAPLRVPTPNNNTIRRWIHHQEREKGETNENEQGPTEPGDLQGEVDEGEEDE